MAPSISADRLQEAIETKFQCHRCGNCCKGDGLVHFGRREADAMARHLGLTRAAFLRRYGLRVEDGQWILKDRMEQPAVGAPREIWCIFLQRDLDGRYSCRVNDAKPDQCRQFPHGWRNPDSFRTCAGLRILMQELKAADNGKKNAK